MPASQTLTVADLMTSQTQTCSIDESLDKVAHLMWEHDCGCVPLVDREGRVAGIVTDRDVCMAACQKDQPLSEIPATFAAARDVVTVQPNDTIERAEALMREHEVRRLPVVDAERRPVGILSVDDLVRSVHVRHRSDGLTADNVLLTLASLGEIRG